MTLPRFISHEGEIILWDSPNFPSGIDEGSVITWNRHPGAFSLLDYVEENGERLRERFLKWADNFGQTMIAGESLIERMSLKDGFSYWWMSPVAEKSPWKSSWIKDVLRLFAWEEILAEKKVRKIVLVSRNGRLQKVLEGFCRKNKLEFQQVSPQTMRHGGAAGSTHSRKLPLLLHGLATLVRQVGIRREFLFRKAERWNGGAGATTICSYFFHLEPGSKKFSSRFWGGLTDLVRDLECPVNWVHLFYKHQEVPTAKSALDKAKVFNTQSSHHEQHAFIDSFLTWRVVARVIRDWVRLFFISLRIHSVLRQSTEGALCFWPLIADDWNASLRGGSAVMNLLWKELFDAALRSAPHQALGIYLWENQPWEQAWIHSWHKHGHGKVIGVAHSTIRFWDLRYFGFKSNSRAADAYPRPLPDAVVINGKGMRDAISICELPFEVYECEALRFAYLQAFCESPKPPPKDKKPLFRILVLGDYLPAETSRMLDLLASVTPSLLPDISFTLKPHPNHRPDLSPYSGLKMNTVTGSLAELLPYYDAAYASNITSAALDAYLAKIPVIVLYPDNDLNYSPLRNRKGVHFVNDSTGFVRAVNLVRSRPYKYEGKDYFHFDPNLKRWGNIFDSYLCQ